MLRGSVVLLHASVEDFLREALRHRLLSDGPGDDLTKVPFPVERSGRLSFEPKITLRQLTNRFPGATAADVAERCRRERHAWAVAELDRRSFNNVADLSAAVRELGPADGQVVGPDGGLLSALMTRRHNIAHHGDHARGGSRAGGVRAAEPLAPIEPADVVTWARAAVAFLTRLCDALEPPEFPNPSPTPDLDDAGPDSE